MRRGGGAETEGRCVVLVPSQAAALSLTSVEQTSTWELLSVVAVLSVRPQDWVACC